MSYKKIPEILRAERTEWSPERGGRNWQMVGGNRVKKYSFSPFTAKARQTYTFYADVVMTIGIVSPDSEGKGTKRRKDVTFIAYVGTYIEFRNAVLSGEVTQHVAELVEAMGGGEIESIAYWRNNKSQQSGAGQEEIEEGAD